MVNRRRSGCSVEGGFFNLAVKEFASELCIFLSVYHGIEFGYRFFKVGRRHAKLFGEISQSICFVDATKLHERFNIFGKGIYRLHDGAVVDVPAHAAGLLFDGSDEFITSGVFLHKAKTLSVDINHIVKTGHLSGAALKCACSGSGKRVDLNVVHAGSCCADLRCHDDAVTRCTGLVG